MASSVRLYSYDANKYAFPAGVHAGSSPPEDLTGELEGSSEQRASALPAMYVFPADRKMPPFLVYSGPAKASQMLEFIKSIVTSNFEIRLKNADEDLGSRDKDIKMF